MNNVLFAFLLTLLAGLSTGIGGLIAFFSRRTNRKFLSISLGFSAGVMIYVSMIEIFAQAQQNLTDALGTRPGSWATVASFFGGMLVIALIDKLIPSEENPHEVRSVEEEAPDAPKPHKLMRMGLMTALAIGIHNFPEGIATFAAGLDSLTLGTSIALAVAVHNIPEGIAVAVPLYYGTGSRKKALFYSFLSGLAEPVGAAIAMFFLFHFLTPTVLAVLFASVAGIMVFISFDELLPMAERWGHHHISIMGIIAGMLLMAIVLI